MKAREERELTPYAENLLKKHNLFRLPIDVGELVRKMGIVLKEEDLEDNVSGFLVSKNKRTTIGVNKGHHRNRQRFTIAHEIAHHELHRNDQDDLFIDGKLTYHRSTAFRDESSNAGTAEKGQEIEANRFAAILLMPESLLEEKIRSEKIDLSDVFELGKLSSLLGVSDEALTIRLVRLKLIDI